MMFVYAKVAVVVFVWLFRCIYFVSSAVHNMNAVGASHVRRQ